MLCPREASASLSGHVCVVSIQLKTQLEQTEATLEDEQTRRQKLTAEFEEVRSYLMPQPL